VQISTIKYGYARVSTDGHSVEPQFRQLTKTECKKMSQTASPAHHPLAQAHWKL
jgi:hypothetical protein